MERLKATWRNPKPSPHKRRWHELAANVGSRVFVAEELVALGRENRWAANDCPGTGSPPPQLGL